MKRHLCATALFALALIPDWASACWPRGGGPPPESVYYAPAYAPVYRGPIYYPAQPVYVFPVAPPMVVPPRVEPMRSNNTGALIEPARPIARPTPAPPQIEPVRPAANVEAPKPAPPAPRGEVPPSPAAKPEPAPAPAPSEPKRGPLLDIPKFDPPKLDLEPKPKLPPVEFPSVPEPKLPPIQPPKDSDPKLAPLETPGAAPAIPAPAPAPDTLIPTPGVPVPKAPDALPPLTLPPDTPVAPSRPGESKSSPLTGAGRELKVSVFAAAGAAPANGLRKVGFYNHTARDLALTIEGKAVTLPAMTYVHAQLPASFTWKCGDKPAAREAVPADASGVDVLIRE